MSTMTLASVAPVVGVFGQESSEETTVLEETSVEEMSEEALSEETSIEGEEEASALQTALEDAIVAYQEAYPESAITQINIKPLESEASAVESVEGEVSEAAESVEGEASELADSVSGAVEGETSAEESVEGETSDEESSEEETTVEGEEAATEEEKAYEIAIEGADGSAKYDSLTGQEIEGEASEEESSEEETEAAEGESSDESVEGETSAEEADVLPIDPETLLPLDDITKTAEETAGFGEAYEYELKIDTEKHETSIWTVQVAENPETPEEGKQGEVVIDAITGEVIETSGDIEAVEAGAEESLEEESAAEGESSEAGEELSESEEGGESSEAGAEEETTLEETSAE